LAGVYTNLRGRRGTALSAQLPDGHGARVLRRRPGSLGEQCPLQRTQPTTLLRALDSAHDRRALGRRPQCSCPLPLRERVRVRGSTGSRDDTTGTGTTDGVDDCPGRVEREDASVDTCTIHPVLCGYKLQAIDVCTLRSLYLRLAYQHAS